MRYIDLSGLADSTPGDCLDSSCANPAPELSSPNPDAKGSAGDVVSQENADISAAQSRVQAQQQTNLDQLLQPAQTYQNYQVDKALGAAAGVAGGTGAALAGAGAGGALFGSGTDLITDAALIRGSGGALAGGLSAAIQGKDPAAVAQAAAVNGLVSTWNPGGALGGGLLGALTNTGLANFENQGFTILRNGTDYNSFSWTSLGLSLGTRFAYGSGSIGPGTDADTITPIGVFLNQSASGVTSGLGAFSWTISQ